MNTTDRWLIERWEKARELEAALNKTREWYADLFHAVHKNVRETHPELDRLDIHLRPNEINSYGGQAIFSHGKWPSESETWRTGIYIWGISLDELATEETPGPNMYIFFHVKKSDNRIEEFRRRIAAEAPSVFKNQVISYKIREEDDNRTLLWYQMPGGKKDLLKKLCEGKEQDFVDSVVEQIGLMYGFVPVLNELFGIKNSSSSSSTTDGGPIS